MFKSLAVLLSVAVFAVSAESCFDADTDYYGNDIGKDTSVSDGAACQRVCQTTHGCLYWTFYDNPGHAAFGCHLKNKKATPTQLPKGTSGPKVCDNDCFKTRAYRGGPIKQIEKVGSLEGCQGWCQQTTNCAYWTLDSRNKCWLNDDTTKVRATTNGGIGGPRECGEPVAEGLGLGTRCNSKSPPCKEANSACITYRCKCVQDWVRYPRNGPTCVAQDTLELDTPCTNPGSACSASNSECRAYRCACKHGFSKSASGDECE